MNSPHKITITVLLFLTSLFFVRCHKSKIQPSCRITSIVPLPSGTSYQLSYNPDGRLLKFIYGNTTTDYFYNNNTITTITSDSGIFENKKIIDLNNLGLTTNVRIEMNLSGSIWTNISFEYNNNELIKSNSTSSQNSSPVVLNYLWSEGNLVSVFSGSTVISIDYYKDKIAQNGDYFYLLDLSQGYHIYQTKNLIKSLQGTIFNYGFDVNGNISSLSTTSGNNTNALVYSYECN